MTNTKNADIRTLAYVLAVGVLTILAVQGYVDDELRTAILETILAAINLMAAVVTWWQNHRKTDDDVTVDSEARLHQIDRIVGNEDELDVDATARIRGIILNGPEDE